MTTETPNLVIVPVPDTFLDNSADVIEHVLNGHNLRAISEPVPSRDARVYTEDGQEIGMPGLTLFRVKVAPA